MKDAGVLFYPGHVLLPAHTARTVRPVDGKKETEEGAYGSEDRHALSGFFILDVADADEALHWASLAPAASSGAVEVRPLK